MSNPTEQTYTVKGMTCGHCEMSVVEEIQEIDGVQGATADHTTGAVTVTSTEPISREAVAAAVEEAGYELV